MENLETGNLEASVTGNPSDPAIESNGTGSTGGEASRQSATAQESFVPRGLDLNTLPPHIRAQVEKINADMVRGFTDKTTKLSETIKTEKEKAIEAYRQKADFYDQIAGQEAFVNKWNEYVKEQERVGQQGGAQDGNPVLDQMKQQLQEMNQKIQLSEMAQVTDAFAEAVDEKGQKIHPDFDNLNNFQIGKLQNGKDGEDFSLLRGCIELAPGNNPQEKLANGYKTAKAVYDQIFEAGKKAGMGRVQAKIQNGTFPPSSSASDVLSVTDKKPKNAREALEMAKRGMVVSRE